MVTRAEPPFFVVGNPRSGTKMLRELLNRSPGIWISDVESHFIPRFTRDVARYGDLGDRASFELLASALRGTRAFWHWERRGVHIDTGRWYRLCQRHDWPGVLEALFHCVHEQEIPDPPLPWDEILWGDKTPAYMAELPSLSALYPHARFVHLVRDARDCVLSTQEAWGNTPLRTAQEWADRVRRCRAGGAALGPSRYHELRYEDLVGDVRGRLAAAFEFLGVPTPENAGEFLRVPENLGSARGAGRVMTGERQKWKQRMSPGLRRRIEEVAGDLLDAYGYEREFPDVRQRRLPAAQMTAYRLADAWRQLRFRRKEQGGWMRGLRFLLAR
jgi:hypothetical protein